MTGAHDHGLNLFAEASQMGAVMLDCYLEEITDLVTDGYQRPGADTTVGGS